MVGENKFKKIEEKWRGFWEKHPELYRAIDELESLKNKKGKKYILVEFPYPSGSGLHVGHAFTFTGGDVYARFKRMQGYNVLYPMGWDAFGLPTENYAIKTKRKPQEVTKQNTDAFRKEMERLAFSFDWEREVNTTDPDYYRWTQWIFIKLFEKGLAYKQEMPINWCLSCKVGLANEEVVDGKCERCHGEVERRNVSQWVVKITDYADKLIEGLKDTDFIEKVKQAQINWIGRSQGARVKFQITNSQFPKFRELEVFTTRADTLWGVTFMVISPEHPFIDSLITNNQNPSNPNNFQFPISNDQKEKVKEYMERARKKSDLERAELQKEKTGVFTGVYVINPVNGKEIPLYVADYVLMGYGTGVVMGVPAHDQRDWDFAKKHNLEIIPVILGKEHDYEKEAMTSVEEGEMINSGFVTGVEVKEAIVKVNEWVEKEGFGKKANMYHLRDWIFSRQHYWGEPIPMIFCEKCAKNQNLESRIKNQEGNKKNINAGWWPVPEEQLPVRLPEVEAYEPTDTGESPLAKMTEFVNTTCPVCGGQARRETDTMPNWAGSDWYYVAYCFADMLANSNKQKTISKQIPNSKFQIPSIFEQNQDKLKYWMPVDVYIGGDEHNTLHLLYSRFIYKFLFDLGVVPTPEPYQMRISHGVILGPDGQRMSKSRGNVVVPADVADKYGADVLRMCLMFMGPFDATMAWNEKTVVGVRRFLEKLEKFVLEQTKRRSSPHFGLSVVKVAINQAIKSVTNDLENFRYNTAIARLMECLNKLNNEIGYIGDDDFCSLIKMLAPFAPYTAEELWSRVRNDGSSVHVSDWPKYDEKFANEEYTVIPVSVNGKKRDELKVNWQTLGTDEMINMAKELPKIKKWLEGCEMIKVIPVPGRLVNFVVRTK